MTVPTSPRNSLDKSKQTTGRTQPYANTLADNRRWTRWAPAGRRRVAPTVLGRCACTSRDARRRRRSFASSRISSARCNSCTTSASPPRTARGAPSCRRSPTSSSRAASSSMALRACAATRARTSTCSPFRARLATSAPVATPNGSRCGRSGWRRRSVAAVPHRQVVLTIPKRLRTWCLYRRALLGDLARVAARTVVAAVRMLTREPDLAVGVVACIQTHGSLANWHPHIHLLVTDGGFRADGTFVSWPAHDTPWGPLTSIWK